MPGPKSKALLARREAAIPRGPHLVTPIFAAKSEGAWIEDVDGNRYLDFAGGIGCLNVGHRSAARGSCAARAGGKFLHLCFGVTPYESYIALAEKLNALAPISGPKKTLFVNSGAECVENAVKIARAYTKRPAVICFEDAFHGRTLHDHVADEQDESVQGGIRAVCDATFTAFRTRIATAARTT